VGFEPTASWSRTRRSTKLSHSPELTVNPARERGARVLISPVLGHLARSYRQATLDKIGGARQNLTVKL
jgi:hypothetical protein